VNTSLRIGTRGSSLALWQARYTQEKLAAIGVKSELVIIRTKGDDVQHLGFDKMEGKGFFTREIEEALLRGDIDLAVHSMKDLPTQSVEGLVITAVSYREDPADILLICKAQLHPGKPLQLPENARVGTSSSRRKAQLRDIRVDLQLEDIRGNVPTRLDKLRSGAFDAIVLAAAGLERLAADLSDFVTIRLDPREMVPAPAQGVLAWQTLREDIATRKILTGLHRGDVAVTTNVERKVLQLMQGGCQMPLGVHCFRDAQGNYHVHAAYAEKVDSPLIRVAISSSTHFQLAEQIVARLRPGC